MSDALDKMTQEVTEATTVQAGAITLLNSLSTTVAQIKAELAAQGIDNAKLNQLGDDLNTSSNALADALVANTPAA